MSSWVIAVSLACTFGTLVRGPVIAESPIEAYEPFANRVRFSELLERYGASRYLVTSRPAALISPPARIVDDPTTNLAIELVGQEVRLAELGEQLTREHLSLRDQTERVKHLKRALAVMKKHGHKFDREQVQAELQSTLALAEANLSFALQKFTDEHPTVVQLRSHIKAVKKIAKRTQAAAKPPARAPEKDNDSRAKD